MEKNNINPISGDIDNIILQNGNFTVWNEQLSIAVNGTNQDIAKFFAKLRHGHLTEVTILLNFKFH